MNLSANNGKDDLCILKKNILSKFFHKLRYTFYVMHIMEMNPFLVSGYLSPDYFCDREQETETLLESVTNNRHTTIISPRRMGKTGLIKHIFWHGVNKKLFIPVYIDILATTSVKEFTETLGRAVLSALSRNETALKKVLKNLASLRPRISIDSMTGEPNVTLTVVDEKEALTSLEIIFEYIRKQKKRLVIAIDEFQQVTNYPEKNLEAALRCQVQHSNNVTMIFSGSRKHVLSNIFMSAGRPFYNSTQILELNKIPEASYREFITHKFNYKSERITEEAINEIFDITGLHTFYVQFLCNRLFSQKRKTDKTLVNETLLRIITENEAVYASYMNLITPLQFRVLRSVAFNRSVANPTGNEFLSKYDLGAASSVAQTIKSLEDKELVTYSNKAYSLNDQFLAQWLIRK